MDPRLRKLRAALWIMGLGTLFALLWHGWQGWVLGRGYPDNGYLYLQSLFTDWTVEVQISGLPSPYAQQFAFYFPATYLLLKPFVWMGEQASLWLYLPVAVLGTLALQGHVLGGIVRGPAQRLVISLVLAAGSFAFVACVVRANLEMGMALLVGWALLLCRRLKFGAAAALLSIPALLKLYPVLLLALFLRRRHLRYIALPALACLLLSGLALLTFSGSTAENLALWQRNMTQYNFLYMIADRGLSGSTSPWNALKIALLTADHFRVFNLHLVPLSNGDHYSLFFLPLSHFYNDVFLGLLSGAVLFATFVEREFFRRAVLFLLFMAICAQAGADYKLLWVHVALVVLIVLPGRRRLDLAAVTLMALVLVPKKEIYLTYLGRTDTTYNDVSFGVLVDPILICAVIVLVMMDGWRERLPGGAVHRFKGLAHQLMDFVPGYHRGR